jgi:hypothetical protein
MAGAIVLAGCGSSSTETTAAPSIPAGRGMASSPERAAYVQDAEAICRRSVARTRALGSRLPQIVSSAPSPQQGITNGLVGPGIAILSQEAASLRNLDPAPASPALATYLGLFDPILALARQRLQAGRAGDPEGAHRLELLIAGLSEEQSAAARRFGLRTCSIEFNTALGASG